MNDQPSENGTDHEKEKRNVIVNYLPPEVTEAYLRSMFSTCGVLSGCKLMRDKVTGVSLGYAFVNFGSEVDAAKAITNYDGHPLGSKKIRVSYARPSSSEIKNANLYISGLPKHIGEEELKVWFGIYGTIISSKLLVLENGESRGVGFIRFDRRSEAQSALDALNGVSLSEGSTLTVKFANPPKMATGTQLPPVSLQTPLPGVIGSKPVLNAGGVGPIYHETVNHRYSPLGVAGFIRTNMNTPPAPRNANSLDPLKGSPVEQKNCSCVFVYGLPPEEKDFENELLLYRLFSPHGAILSVHAKKGQNYGFINMMNYEEAYKAVINLNGYYVQQHNTHLQVSFKKNKPF